MLYEVITEGSGLARAGLRLAGHVVLFEGDRQRGRLNRRTELEAGIADAGADVSVQRQSVKPEIAQMVLRHKI